MEVLTMKAIWTGFAAIALTALSTAGFAEKATLSGDYLEARTCSVYTGACHANGESVTIGREATLAWHINKGIVDGQKVDGLNVVAVIAGKDNLAKKDCLRDCVVYVDAKASEAQREALVDAIQMKYGCALGRITAVKSAPIEYTKKGLEYTLRVPGSAYVRTTRYACKHCVMPHQVWYSPFIPVSNSIVAKAAVNEYKGCKELPTTWTRTDENSSFVGEFAF